jgi:hypothetical protein
MSDRATGSPSATRRPSTTSQRHDERVRRRRGLRLGQLALLGGAHLQPRVPGVLQQFVHAIERLHESGPRGPWR